MLEELRNVAQCGGGGFLPAIKQNGSVATLPGIVHPSAACPDVHSGYGFAVGNIAVFETNDPEAMVSLVVLDLTLAVVSADLNEKDAQPVKEQLAQAAFDHTPVGMASKAVIPMTAKDVEKALEMHMNWSLQECYG